MNIDDRIEYSSDWSRIDYQKRVLQEEFAHGFVFGFVVCCLLFLVFGV